MTEITRSPFTSEGLLKAQQNRLKKVADGTFRRRTPIERSDANPASLRKAIDAKCFQCEGEDADANWQKRVGTCPVTSCPLWKVRPFQQYAITIMNPERYHNVPIERNEDGEPSRQTLMEKLEAKSRAEQEERLTA